MDISSDIRKISGSLSTFSLRQLIHIGGGGNKTDINSTILLQRSSTHDIWRARIFVQGNYVIGITTNNLTIDPVTALLRNKTISSTEADLILKKTAGFPQKDVVEFIDSIGLASELDIITAYTDHVKEIYNNLLMWKTGKFVLLTNYLPPSRPFISAMFRQTEGYFDGNKRYKPAKIVDEDNSSE